VEWQESKKKILFVVGVMQKYDYRKYDIELAIISMEAKR